jgi:hypothetical protein
METAQQEPENVDTPPVVEVPNPDGIDPDGHGVLPPSVENGADGLEVRTSGGGLRPPTPNSVDPSGMPTRATDEG